MSLNVSWKYVPNCSLRRLSNHTVNKMEHTLYDGLVNLRLLRQCTHRYEIGLFDIYCHVPKERFPVYLQLIKAQRSKISCEAETSNMCYISYKQNSSSLNDWLFVYSQWFFCIVLRVRSHTQVTVSLLIDCCVGWSDMSHWFIATTT